MGKSISEKSRSEKLISQKLHLDQLQIGQITLSWLDGGNNHMDGGAMFGVVPKSMWSKKYSANEQNLIEMRADPILIQTGEYNILIDSGMGIEKLNEKQKRIYGVTDPSKLLQSLARLGVDRRGIDYVLLTHMHFDHACGLTMREAQAEQVEPQQDSWLPTFPNAKHIVSDVEWKEVQKPNIRSKHTYWRENWEAIAGLVQPFDKEIEVCSGIKMFHTGGHSAGHAIISIQSEGEQAIHMGDLLPTAAHQNPLWVPAYDDYPMDSIYAKQKWLEKAKKEGIWLTFYHDAVYRAVKWNEEGELLSSIKIGNEDL